MEMIASIKMQKAVRTIGQSRDYIQNAWNILHLLAQKALPVDHPLLLPKQTGKIAVILVTSDRGLCGSYNTEIIKKYLSYLQNLSTVDVVAIGKVGAEYVRKYRAGNLVAEFKGFENNATIEDIMPIFKLTTGEYLLGNYEKVVVVYPHFVSSLKRISVVQQILPISDEHISDKELWIQDEADTAAEYKFEPNPEVVVDSLLKQIIQTQIFGAVLEANASEHSARMVAMKSATDNAKDLIDELTLIYNSVRQDGITREIAEISGAAEAMK